MHNKVRVFRIPCQAICPHQCTRHFLYTYEQGALTIPRPFCGRVLGRVRGIEHYARGACLTFTTSSPSNSRQRALSQNGEVLIHLVRGGVPRPQDCGRKPHDRKLQGEGYP